MVAKKLKDICFQRLQLSFSALTAIVFSAYSYRPLSPFNSP